MLFPMVVDYIQTFGVFVVPEIFNILLGISLQSMGKPQLYMVGNLLSVVLNIILDLIFICVFDMGITGAALAFDFGDFTVCLVDGEFFYPSFNVR
ncbi:polysaccharide biosynthesis C-terminal domain-containing protein [Paenibacillus sp. FSL H8-0261]|uniref:polysaccharide biosynthesis C-terminal domain-containing protein n=1 Tax=unclassified Paenibacillus TaxID=185978 RepID=UPI0030FBD94F